MLSFWAIFITCFNFSLFLNISSILSFFLLIYSLYPFCRWLGLFYIWIIKINSFCDLLRFYITLFLLTFYIDFCSLLTFYIALCSLFTFSCSLLNRPQSIINIIEVTLKPIQLLLSPIFVRQKLSHCCTKTLFKIQIKHFEFLVILKRKGFESLLKILFFWFLNVFYCLVYLFDFLLTWFVLLLQRFYLFIRWFVILFQICYPLISFLNCVILHF